MPLTEDPRVLRAALISFVTAVGDSPAGADLCRRALCAIVGITVVDVAVAAPPSAFTAAQVRELEGLAATLHTQADLAEYLAEKAALTGPAPT